MSDWLDPLRAALDQTDATTTWFFRDDDAGWDDARLFALLNCFAEFNTPIDLAVIPTELTDELAAALLKRRQQNPNLLGLHQHGYGHTNHEVVGRKCEFGLSRSLAQQSHDIERGGALLRAKLGDAIDPIFTPPWNRCTSATIASLQSLNFSALSRDVTAAPLDTDNLIEISVNVDWSKRQNGVEINREILAINMAAASQLSCVGVMLHHAVMAAEDLTALRQCLELLSRHRTVQRLPMAALITTTTQA